MIGPGKSVQSIYRKKELSLQMRMRLKELLKLVSKDLLATINFGI